MACHKNHKQEIGMRYNPISQFVFGFLKLIFISSKYEGNQLVFTYVSQIYPSQIEFTSVSAILTARGSVS